MNNPFAVTASGGALEFANRLRQGTFLIVDDFDSMRKVTINQMKQLGAVKFVEAANGAEALKVLARQPVHARSLHEYFSDRAGDSERP